VIARTTQPQFSQTLGVFIHVKETFSCHFCLVLHHKQSFILSTDWSQQSVDTLWVKSRRMRVYTLYLGANSAYGRLQQQWREIRVTDGPARYMAACRRDEQVEQSSVYYHGWGTLRQTGGSLRQSYRRSIPELGRRRQLQKARMATVFSACPSPCMLSDDASHRMHFVAQCCQNKLVLVPYPSNIVNWSVGQTLKQIPLACLIRCPTERRDLSHLSNTYVSKRQIEGSRYLWRFYARQQLLL